MHSERKGEENLKITLRLGASLKSYHPMKWASLQEETEQMWHVSLGPRWAQMILHLYCLKLGGSLWPRQLQATASIFSRLLNSGIWDSLMVRGGLIFSSFSHLGQKEVFPECQPKSSMMATSHLHGKARKGCLPRLGNRKELTFSKWELFY